MKNILKISIIILVINFSFAIPLFMVNAADFGLGVFTEGGGGGLVACDGAKDCDEQAFFDTLNNVINYILVLATAIATIIFAWAGFVYLTASGDSGKISRAHSMIRVAVIGFLIALAASVIIKTLLESLDYDL